MTSEGTRSDATATRDPNSSMGARGNGSGGLDSARESLSGAASQAGSKVVGGINSQKTRAADGLGTVAQALRQSGEQLRSQDPSMPLQHYVSSAADQVDRLSNYLRSTSVSDMVQGVEQFARRQPAVFIGSAFVLGLIGARFLKSSGRNDTGSYEPARLAGDAPNRGSDSYVDPRTSAGYWRDQQARDTTYDQTTVGSSPTGGETF